MVKSKARKEHLALMTKLAKDDKNVKREVDIYTSTVEKSQKILEALKKERDSLKSEYEAAVQATATCKRNLSTVHIELESLTKEESEIKVKLSVLRNSVQRGRNQAAYLATKTKNTPDLFRKKRRRLKPSGSGSVCERTKKNRWSETFRICSQIHGGIAEDQGPTVDGMLETLGAKCKSKILAMKIMKMKGCVVGELKGMFLKENCITFYKSEENKLRSLSVYYCSHVLGKNKYKSVRKANKTRKNIPNFIPYDDLSKKIRSIDIGEIIPFEGNLDKNLDDEEIGKGYYRNLQTYLPRLAKFYLCRNERRTDKLRNFGDDTGKFLFLFTIGGDEAPGCGTSFLLSFLNCGKRVCSSFENFLIFGGFVKENGEIVRRYVKKLAEEINIIESQTYSILAAGSSYLVQFKLELLPNDLKMLAFLAGELSNAAHYFSTFANVTKDDAHLDKGFSTGKPGEWLPFSYEKRLQDVLLVEKKKEALKKKGVSEKTFRTNVTSYIKTLKSRQEFVPLVGRYIDKALGDPLHLKNNVCKEVFLSVWNLVVTVQVIPAATKCYTDLPPEHIICVFMCFLKSAMQLSKLKKKMIEWFNDCREKRVEFSFRFRGEESRAYLLYFPQLLAMLKGHLPSESPTMYKRLAVIFAESMHLRKLISFSVRILDITPDDVMEMKICAKKLYNLFCKYDHITPSIWTLLVAAPVQSQRIYEKLGMGLGANSMEGREQKHQVLKKYMANTTVQQRWEYVFRHEFISCIYIRENGFDDLHYKKKTISYFPKGVGEEGLCYCGLALQDGLCDICNWDVYTTLSSLFQ